MKPTTDVTSAFRRLGVTRIVVVDDDMLRDEWTVVIADLKKPESWARGIFKNVDFTAPEVTWEKEASLEFQHANREKKDRILKAAGHGELAATLQFLAVIEGFGSLTVEAVDPDNWERIRDKIVADATAEARVVVLFDRDLSHADRPNDAGEKLAVEFARSAASNCVFCGLVSATYDPEHSPEFNSELGIFRIAKSELPGKPWEIAHRLIRLVITPKVLAIRAAVNDAMDQGHKATMKDLHAIDLYEFASAFIRRSDAEGVSEASTLLRVYVNLFRRHARKALLHKAEAFSAAEEIREFSEAQNALTRAGHEDDGWKLQFREMYDFDVNQLKLPLDFGDVFVITSGKRSGRYILLEPQCDLILRGENGRKLNRGTLFRVAGEGGGVVLPLFFSSFDPDSRKNGVVAFHNRISVNLDVLDLCTTNIEGEAVYDPSVQLGPETPPSSRRRLAGLIARIGENASAESFFPILDDNWHPDSVNNNQRLVIKIKRERRLSADWAYYLLQEVAIRRSRPGLDMDLGRQLAETLE